MILNRQGTAGKAAARAIDSFDIRQLTAGFDSADNPQIVDPIGLQFDTVVVNQQAISLVDILG